MPVWFLIFIFLSINFNLVLANSNNFFYKSIFVGFLVRMNLFNFCFFEDGDSIFDEFRVFVSKDSLLLLTSSKNRFKVINFLNTLDFGIDIVFIDVEFSRNLLKDFLISSLIKLKMFFCLDFNFFIFIIVNDECFFLKSFCFREFVKMFFIIDLFFINSYTILCI